MSDTYRHIQVETDGDISIITLTVSNLQEQLPSFELKKELIKFIERVQPEKVIINFEHVHRFSTEFIGTLLSTKKRHSETRQVNLCRMQPVHREIFSILKLDGTVFQICDTVEEAKAAFQK